MPNFHFKAIKNDGSRYEGTITAADKIELYSTVQKDGGTLVSYEEESQGSFSIDRLLTMLNRVKEDEKIILMRNMSAMIKAGLALSRALSVMIRQTKNAKLRQILMTLDSKVQEGGTLHEALATFPNVFSPLVVAMVKSGEESGQLADTFRTISEQMDRAHTLKKKIRGALIYPAIIVTVLILVGALMLIFIVPTLKTTFDELGVALPLSTQVIIGFSNFLVNHTLIAPLLLLGIVGGFLWGIRTEKGRRVFQFVLLRTPVVKGLVREINAARTARTLSSLLTSGVPIVQALSITRDVVQNVFFKEVLLEAEKIVQKGEPIASAFSNADTLYPPLVGELMAVGEETGRLPDMLTEIADFYEREVEQKTKDMSTIIEPFLMVIVGAAVGFFAISMITPIYSISEGL